MATSYKTGSGGTYKISTGNASMERMTRQAASDEVLQRFIESAEKRRPPVDDSGEADLRWGEPSRFTLVESDAPTNPSYTVNNSGGPGEEPDDPEDEGIVIIDYDEVEGQRTFFPEVRVTNEEDPTQYVDVEDTQSIMFLRRNDSAYIRLNFLQPERN